MQKREEVDLIITTLHIEDMHVIKFAQKDPKQAGINTPIILLAYDNRERKELVFKLRYFNF